MKRLILYVALFPSLLVLFAACKNKQGHAHGEHDVYTCSMHPQVIKNEPGNCPICGMTLVKKEQRTTVATGSDSLDALLRPTNEFVVASLPVTTLQQSKESRDISALGVVQHDNRHIQILSSRIGGRIEKLYVRYRYQFVSKGQKVLEIYSPELLTAQQNLIFLLRSDPGNHSLINAARQRLLLLGMSGQQVAQISRSGKPLYSVAIYSTFSGYVTEPGFNDNMTGNAEGSAMGNSNSNTTATSPSLTTTTELPVKEGMYVEKGQPIFTLINASHGRVSLSIFASEQSLVKAGTPIMIIPETAPEKKFSATIDRLEPFFKEGSKTLSARVYFNNAALKLPFGSQVRATIFGSEGAAYWLPSSAVITTGLKNIVFKKEGSGFRPVTVTTGTRNGDRVQITAGLSPSDSVAINAQHLTESESIITLKN